MFAHYRTGSKRKAQQKHALRRAYERYGLKLNDHDLHGIVKAIQCGESVCVNKQTWRVSVHDLHYREWDVRVVYDRERKTVVTFLTHDQGVWEERDE